LPNSVFLEFENLFGIRLRTNYFKEMQQPSLVSQSGCICMETTPVEIWQLFSVIFYD
jgi:hypothetical protein